MIKQAVREREAGGLLGELVAKDPDSTDGQARPGGIYHGAAKPSHLASPAPAIYSAK